MPIYCIVNM